ncbi:tetratricopeptide repeat protein [Sulfurimonas sp.]
MRFIYFLLLIGVGLFADSFENAVSLYNQEEYIQAYEKFYILYNKNEKNEKATLYLAKSLYNLGEYSEAGSLLASLYKKDRNNDEIVFFLAKSLYEQKEYKRAKELFLKIKQITPYALQSKEYLQKIELVTTLHKYFFLLSVGLTYDNNIRNNTYEPTTNYEFITLNNDTNATSDTFIDKMFYMKHSYKMKNYTNMVWNDVFLVYHRNGLRYSDQNMLYISLLSGPSVHKKGFIFQPKILLNDLHYGQRHYMYAYGLDLMVSKDFVKQLKAKFKITLKKDKYIHDEDKTKDDSVQLYQVNLRYILNRDNIFHYALTYQKTRKAFGSRVDISRNEYLYEIGYERKLLHNYRCSVAVKYQKRHYLEQEISLGQRDDNKMYYTGSISKGFKTYYNLSLTYKHIKNHSTISAFSYKKSTVSVMLSRYF